MNRSSLPDDFLVSRDVRSGAVHFTSRRDGRESYSVAREPLWLWLKETVKDRFRFVSRDIVERARGMSLQEPPEGLEREYSAFAKNLADAIDAEIIAQVIAEQNGHHGDVSNG